MRRARSELQRADLAIVVLDARELAAGRAAVAEAIADVPQRLWLHNKADLIEVPANEASPPGNDAGEPALRVSALTGTGLEALHRRLRQLAHGDHADGAEGAFTARQRHVDALGRARSDLADAAGHLQHEMLDLAAEALRGGHDALGEITGRVRADDLLGHIFSSFCIGK